MKPWYVVVLNGCKWEDLWCSREEALKIYNARVSKHVKTSDDWAQLIEVGDYYIRTVIAETDTYPLN